MNKQLLQTLLAFIFVLLQCAAPLVHAHVNGEQEGVLPLGLGSQHFLLDHLEAIGGIVENDESPAIDLSHEFQRNDHPALPRPVYLNLFIVNLDVAARFNFTIPAPKNFFSPYSKSHPQAPPALG